MRYLKQFRPTQGKTSGEVRLIHVIDQEFGRIATHDHAELLSPPADVTADFTWDDAWHDIDFRAKTATWARVLFLSVYAARAGAPLNAFKFSVAGGTTPYAQALSTRVAATDYACGQVLLVPMNVLQRFAYSFPDNAAADKKAYLLGYM